MDGWKDVMGGWMHVRHLANVNIIDLKEAVVLPKTSVGCRVALGDAADVGQRSWGPRWSAANLEPPALLLDLLAHLETNHLPHDTHTHTHVRTHSAVHRVEGETTMAYHKLAKPTQALPSAGCKPATWTSAWHI
jgi:hypothetical protein